MFKVLPCASKQTQIKAFHVFHATRVADSKFYSMSKLMPLMLDFLFHKPRQKFIREIL